MAIERDDQLDRIRAELHRKIDEIVEACRRDQEAAFEQMGGDGGGDASETIAIARANLMHALDARDWVVEVEPQGGSISDYLLDVRQQILFEARNPRGEQPPAVWVTRRLLEAASQEPGDPPQR